MQRSQSSPVKDTVLASLRVAIASGLPAVRASATTLLARQGFTYDPDAPIMLIFNIPRGFALHVLESLQRKDRRIIVVTWSFSPEYCEDLWDFQLDGLIVGDGMTLEIATAITQVSQGARYRLTPARQTPLNQSERRILRLLARGYSNQQIAQQCSMQLQTIKNMVASIYRKLQLKNRSQAVLHYWGILHTLAHDASPPADSPSGQ